MVKFVIFDFRTIKAYMHTMENPFNTGEGNLLLNQVYHEHTPVWY